jgi:DNA-binding Lrp family transcriptional regulator
MKAIVLIKIQTGQVRPVVRDLKRIHAIVEVNATFGPFDAIAIVETGNLHDIGRIVTKEIQPIPGVLETLTCLTVEAEFSEKDPLPPVAAGERVIADASGFSKN